MVSVGIVIFFYGYREHRSAIRKQAGLLGMMVGVRACDVREELNCALPTYGTTVDT